MAASTNIFVHMKVKKCEHLRMKGMAAVLPAMGLFLMMFTPSCVDDILEVKETIYSAEDNAIIETEFTALYDLLDDLAETDEKLRKKGGTILPSGAEVTYLDTIWSDGDGVEVLVDFGPLGETEPKGLLCKDGKYRAGKIKATLSKPFKEVGSSFIASLSEKDAYFSGDGSDMVQLSGTLGIYRIGENTINIDVVNGMATKEDRAIKWTLANRTIRRTLDAGPGVWGDHFEITGDAQGVNRNGEEFTVTIDEPLLKKMETGCAQTFIKGRLTITVGMSAKIIVVDYDPFNDQACDRIAGANVNGKTTTFTVK